MPSAEDMLAELKRTIDRLNITYDLGIRIPDPTLSPRKAKLLNPKSDEDGDKLYRLIRFNYFRDPGRLSACIGRFHHEASAILGSSSEFGKSAQKRAVILRTFLDILQGNAGPKRSLDEFVESEPKRPKSREAGFRPDLVDALPVRSSPLFGSSPGPRASSLSNPSERRFVNTPDNDYDEFPMTSNEYRDLVNRFYEENLVAKRRPSAPVSMIERFNSSPGWTPSFDQKLQRIWPCLPGLDSAPMAVLWEFIRIFQSCGVEPSTYQYDEKWLDQQVFRNTLASDPSLKGKTLPPACSSKAWSLATTSFSTKTDQVYLTAELEICPPSNKVASPFRLSLKPLEVDQGCRLSRRFGADRFLTVNIPDPKTLRRKLGEHDRGKGDALVKFNSWLFSSSPHVFLGREWVPYFFSKKGTKKGTKKATTKGTKEAQSMLSRIFLFATDGPGFRKASAGAFPCSDEALTPLSRTKMTLDGLTHWAIGIKDADNSAKSAVKLFSRWSLSHTKTWPTEELERSQIRFKRDIGTHEVMNDGLGRMSKALARKIASHLGLSDTPAGYQGRIGSAKGFWIIDVESELYDGDVWIELYPSQIKWKCDFLESSYRIFEVRAYAREAKTGSLNHQFIPLLEAQAIDRLDMRRCIEEALRNSLMADLEALMLALDHPEDLRLWLRQVGQTSSQGVRFLAGLPRSKEDIVAFLVDAGFRPRQLRYMQELCREIGEKKAESLMDKLHVPIPQSTNLFMVADFTGVLEEGQICVNFSTKFEADDFCDTALDGLDVLVARAPAHTLSDIQKVVAVSHPKLRKLKDVVVFSTKGTKPLAALLSGGDYDGDICWVCWDRKIVDNFRGAPVPESAEGPKVDKLHMTVDDLTRGTTVKYWRKICYKFTYLGFLFSSQPDMLGICTVYKERLSYRWGAGDGRLAKLSALLGELVDQSKQGIIFDHEAWARFCREEIRPPRQLEDPAYFNAKCVAPEILGDDSPIQDVLKFKVGQTAVGGWLKTLKANIESSEGVCKTYYDADLTAMYNRVDARRRGCEAIDKLLKGLKADLDVVQEEWHVKMSDENSDFEARCEEVFASWRAVAPSAELLENEEIRRLVDDGGIQHRTLSWWSMLKASATFKHFHGACWKFAWRMAGVWGCHLKAQETVGLPPAVVQLRMYSLLCPSKKMKKGAAQRVVMEDDYFFF
ncbi:hypothetical protein L249_6515 [Ophiocordyceps polyrhachis-furcata BCC 54312]|uniref:RNA-dependent RNA polymerase n=1 Tax=Ophiocordyceps polyrhachis-furcata BCC 54312 TaxID=1330021 RepID=A0A367LK94_9HYPO|nr:hypothetical protein L249_6515 [Ophiocordyceps polyrhachis-furcata BCC 54312]